MDYRFVDFDQERSIYKYGYTREMSQSDHEQLKLNRGPVVNKLTSDYIAERINYYLSKEKIILVAPSTKIVNYLIENKIPYCLVYHSLDAKDEYRERMIKRGNVPEFVDSVISALEESYRNNLEDNSPACKIELKKGQYLSDVIGKVYRNKI